MLRLGLLMLDFFTWLSSTIHPDSGDTAPSPPPTTNDAGSGWDPLG